jgi:hypothetical protein
MVMMIGRTSQINLRVSFTEILVSIVIVYCTLYAHSSYLLLWLEAMYRRSRCSVTSLIILYVNTNIC